jgi:hypothetical protein
MSGQCILHGYTRIRVNSCSRQDRVEWHEVLSCYSEGFAIENVEIAHFWNIPFDTFRL